MNGFGRAGRSLALSLLHLGALTGSAFSQEPALVSRSRIEVDEVINAIALSDDGSTLAYGGWGCVLSVAKTDGGREVHRIGPLETPIADASFNRDGSMLIVAGTANISPMMGFISVPFDKVDQVEASKIAAASEMPLRRDIQGVGTSRMPIMVTNSAPLGRPMQGRVYTIDLREGEPKLTVVARDSSPLPAVHPAADRSLVGVLDHDLKLRSVSTAAREPVDLAVDRKESEEHVNTENEYLVPSTAFSDDAKRVVTITTADRGKFVFRLLDPSSGEMEILNPRGQSSAPWTVDLSPDGRRFVSGGAGPRVYLWDYEKREKIGEFDNSQDPDSHVKYVKFSGDGSRILTFDDRNVVRLWRADGTHLITQFEAEASNLRRATVHEDRIVLAFGGNRPAFARIPSVPAEPISIFVYQFTQ